MSIQLYYTGHGVITYPIVEEQHRLELGQNVLMDSPYSTPRDLVIRTTDGQSHGRIP